jgi:uncharacterized protein (TIGR03437 family)
MGRFIAWTLPAICLAQGQFQCQRTDLPVTVRSEGMTELVSDVVLKCTGGTPTNAGAVVPRYQIMLTSSAPLSSRLLVPGTPGTGISEALLIIDEPDFARQNGCLTNVSGDSCPAISGDQTNPNVFQSRQIQANAVTFRSVPIEAPGARGVRTLRITNLRVNVAGLVSQSPPSKAVTITAQLFDPNGASVPVSVGDPSVAELQSGESFAVRTIADTPPALKGTPAITIPPATLPVGAPQSLIGFNLKFTDGFSGAFRRRNVATSSDNPLFMTVQAVPGLPYITESGFLNTLFPNALKMDAAGLADSGTRLIARFQNVPKDVLIWVTTRDIRAGTTQYSETSARAILTTADANGVGPLTPVKPSINGLSQIPVVNGTATAVWEVVSASPAVIQDISFGVAVSAQTANPGQGTVLVTAGMGPWEDAKGANDAIPLFKSPATAIPAFAVSNLLTVPALNCMSAASYGGTSAAPGSIVACFGSGLAGTTAIAQDGPTAPALSGSSVELIDIAGTRRSAQLFFVSPSQINFQISPDLEPGPVLVNVTSGTRLVASGYLQLERVAPSIFSANGDGAGVLAGEALLSGGAQSTTLPVALYDSGQRMWMPKPLTVGTGSEFLFLTLYGTGIRGRQSLTDVTATVAGAPVPVTYAGAQGFFPGLDQVNIGPLPKSLAGRGLADIVISVRGQSSNPVQVHIQ